MPAAFDWDDIGDFDSLAALLAAATDGRRPVLGDAGLVRAVDATGLVVPAPGGSVAVVGLDDVVVVDTPDALLVTTRARAQDVKAVVAALKDGGRRRPHLTRARAPAGSAQAIGAGLGRVEVGVLLMKASSAAPLGSEQYWQTPTCLLVSRRRRRRRPTSA